MFEPNGDRYLVKFLDQETETKSGIILTSAAQEKPQFAEIVAVGNGQYKDKEVKMRYKKGDKISFVKYAANEVRIDDEEYSVVKQEDILGKLV